MRKGGVLIGGLFVAGGLLGYYGYPEHSPYDLDYHRITLNVLIEYTKIMMQPTYPSGEKYLAEDMAKEFQKQGFTAKMYSLEETYSNRDFRSGYDLFLRPLPELRKEGYHNIYDQDKISILYETFTYALDEVKNADIVFTGSLKKDKEYKKLGINSHFLPQFTRFDKFYPAFDEKYKAKVIFIGNQWPGADTRPIIDMIKNTGLQVDIYGDGYEETLTGKYASLWKAEQVVPGDLKYHYSSADIVLNDTRPDMVEAGFISNRIFDVTACKGFIISDYIPEIEEIYGDTIPMYKNETELKELVEYYLNHPEERKEKVERAYQITIKNYSADKMLNKMIDVLETYRKSRGLTDEGDK